MNARLERTLLQLAKQHAPHLIPVDWPQLDLMLRGPQLARRLAGYNLLVMMGYLSPPFLPSREKHIQQWVNDYGQLYGLLARHLFPSLTAVRAEYADNELPALIIINGAAIPIMHVLAGFIVPYIATRQSHPNPSEPEMLGLMDIVLKELEAGDLPRSLYEQIKSESAEIIRRLLESPVRQVGITMFDRPIIGKVRPMPAPPEKLPEQEALSEKPAPEKSTPPPEKPAPPPEQATPPLEKPAPPTPPQATVTKPGPPDLNEPPPKAGDSNRFGRRLPVPDLPDDPT